MRSRETRVTCPNASARARDVGTRPAFWPLCCLVSTFSIKGSYCFDPQKTENPK